jgi:hypothetical protein
MRVAANDGMLHRWREMADALTTEEVDLLEAFDRIEPIGVRPLGKSLAFIAASLGQFFGDKEAHVSDWWPEDKRDASVKPVSSKQAINLLRAAYGG